MLTHSGRRTSWLLCREGLALGSGRWERGEGCGHGASPAGAMRVLPAACYTQTAAHGSLAAFSAFYFPCFMQCARLNLVNLARSLSFLIGKENAFFFFI